MRFAGNFHVWSWFFHGQFLGYFHGRVGVFTEGKPKKFTDGNIFSQGKKNPDV